MTPKFIITIVTHACMDVYATMHIPNTHNFYIRRPRTDRMMHALSKLRQKDIIIPDVCEQCNENLPENRKGREERGRKRGGERREV